MCFIIAFFGDIHKDQGCKRHNNLPSSSSVLVKCAAIHFADTILEKNLYILYQSCFFRISASPHLHIAISPSLYITLYPHNSTYPWFNYTHGLFQTAPSLTIGSVISSQDQVLQAFPKTCQLLESLLPTAVAMAKIGVPWNMGIQD